MKKRKVLIAILSIGLVAGLFSACTQKENDISMTNSSVATSTELPTITPAEKSTKVDDVISYGAYEQDNNTSNGAEAIEWRVLAIEDGKALLIADKNLDSKPYNTEYIEATWETCTLRSWLNNDFYNIAFTASQKQNITANDVTNDKIFVLSIEEANKYFTDDMSRRAANTAYTKTQVGVYDFDGYSCWWLLRAPGGPNKITAGVDSFGKVFEDGYYVNSFNMIGVRPVFWLNLQP